MKTTQGRLGEIWPTLSKRQRDFVVAMNAKPGVTKADASKRCGVTPDTVYRWPKAVDECIALYQGAVVEAAMAELTGATLLAARHKVEELSSRDPNVAARAATELLDRALGKPTQRVESQNTHEVDVSEGRLSGVLDKLVARAARLPNE